MPFPLPAPPIRILVSGVDGRRVNAKPLLSSSVLISHTHGAPKSQGGVGGVPRDETTVRLLELTLFIDPGRPSYPFLLCLFIISPFGFY